MKKTGLLLLFVVAMASFSCNYNACVDSQCQNGAVCVNGECKCAFGYEGENCQTQVFASVMVIDSVKLEHMLNPTGLSWDPEYDTSDVNSYPDVYMEIWTSKRDTTYLGEISQTNLTQMYDGKTVNLMSNLRPVDLPKMIYVDSMLVDMETSYSIECAFYDDDVTTAESWGSVEQQFIATASDKHSGLKTFQIGTLLFTVYYTVVP